MKRPVFQAISACFGIFQDNLTGGGVTDFGLSIADSGLRDGMTRPSCRAVRERGFFVGIRQDVGYYARPIEHESHA
jgi:hypothetical protein